MVDKEQVLFKLNLELHAFGVQYRGDDPQKAAEVLQYVKEARAGKPPCFARAFNHDDITCRQCELFRKCHLGTTFPKFTLDIPEGGLVACDWCDGDFVIELYDGGGMIADFACSTDGCRNTWRLQMERNSG